MIAKNLPAGWATLSVPLILIDRHGGKLACGFLAEHIGIIRTVVNHRDRDRRGVLLCWYCRISPRICCCPRSASR